MTVRIKIINEFGSFESEIMDIPDNKYDELILLSKTFWITDSSFNLTTETSEIFFPPEILNKSILVVERIDDSKK